MEKEKVEKKKGSGILVTVLVVCLIIAAAFGGYLVGASHIVNKVEKQVEEKETEQPLEITDEVKERINKFVEAASYQNAMGYGTVDYFKDGVTGLTNNVKYKMTLNTLLEHNKYEKDIKLSEAEAANVNGTEISTNEPVDRMKLSDFNSTYKEFFNEDPIYEIEDLKATSCPMPAAINKDLGYIYLLHRCGGSGRPSYKTTSTTYDSDLDYYYVHQEMIVENAMSGETETIKLLWKFDENFNFISTRVE